MKTPAPAPPELARAMDMAKPAFAAAGLKPSTVETRMKYWRVWCRWCMAKRAPYLPSDEYTVIAYLVGLKPLVATFVMHTILNVHAHYGYALSESEIKQALGMSGKRGRPKKG